MIYSLVTLYNPEESVKNNIEVLSKQVDKIYLIDNSKNDNSLNFTGINNAEYMLIGKNLGLSLAFNKVLTERKFEDDDFIIFFDQDSHISDNYIVSLKNEYEKLESDNIPVGCLGPFYFDTNSGKIEIPKRKKRINDNTYSVKSIITSSMFTRFGIIKEIGFWNEDIFLDMADWDLCWRLINNHKLCCITNVVTLQHTLGKGEKKVGLMRIRQDGPFRVYYQTRDCLRLFFKKYVPCKYKIRFCIMLTVRPIIHFIFLGEKKERIKFFFKGIRDFQKGIHGSL